MQFAQAVFGLFFFLIWLAVIIFVFTMLYRFVKAMEKIAENSQCTTLVLKDIAETIKKTDDQ